MNPFFAGQRRRRHSFSLVELVLALALISFVLVTVLGLAAVAVSGTKDADMSLRLGLLSSRISSTYRSQWLKPGTAATNPFSASYAATNFYTLQGMPTNVAAAYFCCDIANVTPAGSSANIALLQLTIRWPNPQLTSTNVSLISICNYQ